MSYNSLRTTLAAAAVIGVGALAFPAHAQTYWRHHYHHRHWPITIIGTWPLFP